MFGSYEGLTHTKCVGMSAAPTQDDFTAPEGPSVYHMFPQPVPGTREVTVTFGMAEQSVR